ncbi:carboxypeptidase regulatory-like domain-containing protein, partial [bacterium]|nr:carboxypeptidase regulatory-like domain-containing protein [bacterium]
VVIKAPCSFKDTYTLRLLYNGFIIHEEPVKLRYIRKLLPIKKSVEIELYDFCVKPKDTWGLTPEFELTPILTSNEMVEPVSITAERAADGSYLFTNLYPAEYQLNLKYKSFNLEETVDIPVANGEISLVLPTEYDIGIRVFGLRGMPLKDTTILITREGEKIEKYIDNEGFTQFSLPQGVYTIKAYLKDDLIGERKINVVGERTVNLATIEEPVFPLIITGVVCILVLLSMFFMFRRKNVLSFLKIVAVALAIISIVSPWWILSGSTAEVETTTTMFLTPPAIVTMTTAPDVIAGEIPLLPELLISVMNLLSVAIVVGCLLIVAHMIFKRFNKKRCSIASFSIGALALTASLIVLSYAMSILTKVGVGGIFGGGTLDINIVGEGLRTPV